MGGKELVWVWQSEIFVSVCYQKEIKNFLERDSRTCLDGVRDIVGVYAGNIWNQIDRGIDNYLLN